MSDTSAANSYLLVPINVEALVVGTAARSVDGLAARIFP